MTTPSRATHETDYALFGDPDHSGGSEGYSGYTYAGGPYNLTSSAKVSSLYFYCAATGHVKLAIYNATYSYISSWKGTVTSDGWDYHPYMLLTQSSATACTAGSWDLISLPALTLPAGIYFIVVKGDTTGIIGVSALAPKEVHGDAYGYDQFITEDYTTAFDNVFPTVEGAMGSDPSVYVPTAPYVLTNYTFSQWEDGETGLTRNVNVNGNQTIKALYYSTGPTTISTSSTSTTSTSTSTTIIPTSYIYCVGSDDAPNNQAYYAAIANVKIVSWQPTTPYPISTSPTGCSIYNSYIYCVGDNANPYSLVYYAPISSTGIGTWIPSNSYPISFTWAGCSIYAGYLYCVGPTANAYYAPISSTGIGTWTKTTSYPVSLNDAGCSIYNGYIYCVGTISTTDNNEVYYAPISSTGIGTWTASTPYPPGKMYGDGCSISGNGYIYCVGNWGTSLVYYAPVTTTGIGAWQGTTTYPGSTITAGCGIYGSYIYCIGGGWPGSTAYYSQISSTGVGPWTQTVSYPLDLLYNYCQIAGSGGGGWLGGGGPSSFVSTIITTSTSTSTSSSITSTTAIQSSGSSSSGGSGASGGGGGGGNVTSIVSYSNSSTGQTGYEILNFTSDHTQTFSISGKQFNTTLNFITPTSAGVTINGHSYTLGQGEFQLLNSSSSHAYYASLISISSLPILQTADMAIYSMPMQQTSVTTAQPTTSLVPTTTITPATTLLPTTSVSAANSTGAVQGVSLPILPIAVGAIVTVILVFIAIRLFLENKKEAPHADEGSLPKEETDSTHTDESSHP
jgi:hypothetical protein